MAVPPEVPDEMAFKTVVSLLGAGAAGLSALLHYAVKKALEKSEKTDKLHDQLLNSKLDKIKSELLLPLEHLRSDFRVLQSDVRGQMLAVEKSGLAQAEKFVAALKGIQAMVKQGELRFTKLEKQILDVHHYCERISRKDEP